MGFTRGKNQAPVDLRAKHVLAQYDIFDDEEDYDLLDPEVEDDDNNEVRETSAACSTRARCYWRLGAFFFFFRFLLCFFSHVGRCRFSWAQSAKATTRMKVTMAQTMRTRLKPSRPNVPSSHQRW